MTEDEMRITPAQMSELDWRHLIDRLNGIEANMAEIKALILWMRQKWCSDGK